MEIQVIQQRLYNYGNKKIKRIWCRKMPTHVSGKLWPFVVVGILNKFAWDLCLVNTKSNKIRLWIEVMVKMFENK